MKMYQTWNVLFKRFAVSYLIRSRNGKYEKLFNTHLFSG